MKGTEVARNNSKKKCETYPSCKSLSWEHAVNYSNILVIW